MNIDLAARSKDTALFGDPNPSQEDSTWVLYINAPFVDYEIAVYPESKALMPMPLIISGILRKSLKLRISLGKKNEYAIFKLSTLTNRLDISEKEAINLLNEVKRKGGEYVSITNIDQKLYGKFYKAFVLNKFEAVLDRGSVLQKVISFYITDGDYVIMRVGYQVFGEWNPIALGAKEEYDFFLSVVKDEPEPVIKIHKQTSYPFRNARLAIISSHSDTVRNGWRILVIT